MLCRRHVLLLILVTLTAFCGLAAAKLRATAKYDRIQVGMTYGEVLTILGTPDTKRRLDTALWENDEGTISLDFVGILDEQKDGEWTVVEKRTTRRGPAGRLLWLAGWRSEDWE